MFSCILSENGERYASVVEKYIESNDEEFDTWEATVARFSYGDWISRSPAEALTPLLKKYSSDPDKLVRLAFATHGDESFSEKGIHFWCSIADAALQVDSEYDISKFFSNSFNYNTGSRSKSGVGVAYDQDIEKKNLLEKVIAANNYKPQVMVYLNVTLVRVNAVIDAEIQSDKDRFKW